MPVATQSVKARELKDRAELAHYTLSAKGTVLARLFEIFAAQEYAESIGRGVIVDFTKEREHDFWNGVRMLMSEVLDEADHMAAALRFKGEGGVQ